MKFTNRTPAEKKLLHLIKTGLASSFLLDSLEITKRVFVDLNPELLPELVNKLQGLQKCLPKEACGPDDRSDPNILFMPFIALNADPEEIFDKLTQDQSPELILDKYAIKSETMEEIKAQLSQKLQELKETGILHCYIKLGPAVFPQLKAFNVILDHDLFTYDDDLTILKAAFKERVDERSAVLQSKSPKLFSGEIPEDKRSTRGKTIISTLTLQQEVAHVQEKQRVETPAYLIELLKSYIATVEIADKADHVVLNHKEFTLAEQGLLFMKKHMKPSDFLIALGEINLIINEAIRKKDPKGIALYQIEQVYELGLGEGKVIKSGP